MGHASQFALEPSHAENFTRALECVLIALLAFMPLAFGVVEAWSEQIVVVLCAMLWAIFAAKLALSPGRRIRWRWTYLPVVLFLSIAALQCISLPTGIVRLLSPGTAAAKQQLLGAVPELRAHMGTMTLSFYPWATAHDLRLAFAVATLFFLVTNEFRRPDQIKRLLAAISIIGGAVVLLCLMQNVLGNGKIYGFVPINNRVASSGPFVNHGHYAQFVNLSMGAALGWLMVLLEEYRRDKRTGASATADHGIWGERKIVAILILLVLGTTTVFLSLSRGGMIGTLIAATSTGVVLSLCHPRKGQHWALIAIALLAFSCILYMGFDAVWDRLATLKDLQRAQSGRLQILKDILLAWTQFPLFGTGLGTHSVVYPMFDRSTIPALAGHAENEYAQTAEEMGIFGLGALAAFGILTWWRYARIVRRSREPIAFAAYGLGFGLLAALLQSLSDFGQHLPANAALSAVFCAILISLDRLNRPEHPRGSLGVTGTARRSRYGLASLLLCSGGIWIWALLQANQSRSAELHWARVADLEAHVTAADWQQSDAVYADLITHASRASTLEPGNIHYRHWLNVYRWRSISRTTDLNGAVLLDPRGLEFARRIAQDLRETMLLCPTFGPTWCVLGQLEYSMLGEDRGLDHLRKSTELCPNDPTVCLVAGLTDIARGRAQEGLARLRKAVQLDGRLYPEVAKTCVRDLQSPEAAMDLAEGQLHRLTQLADVLTDLDANEEQVRATEDQITGLLESQCRDPEAPASCFASLGRLYEKQKDMPSAVRCMREALARDYSQVSHHLALARLLARLGATGEAAHEARVCLRLRPRYEPAERLLAELSSPSTSSSNEIRLNKAIAK